MQPDHDTVTPLPMVPSIAVVIPTYQRPELLRRCLNALLRQSAPPWSYEIIVVDDGRSEDTERVVDEMARQTDGVPSIRYLTPRNTRGPAGARNRGWRATKARIIAFTDDDTIPDRDWLEHGRRALLPMLPALGGRVIVPTGREPTDHERNTQGLEAAEFATANVFVWRAALETVGGFDERYTRAWREDSDLHFALLQRFGTVGHARDAVVVHPVRPAPWGVSLQQQANVYFDALLFKKHPDLYRRKIRPRPPWEYYVVVLCTLAALGFALARQPGLAVALAAPAVGTVGAFARSRLRGTSRAPAHVAEIVLTSAAIPFLSVWWRLRGALRFRVPFV